MAVPYTSTVLRCSLHSRLLCPQRTREAAGTVTGVVAPEPFLLCENFPLPAAQRRPELPRGPQICISSALKGLYKFYLKSFLKRHLFLYVLFNI